MRRTSFFSAFVFVLAAWIQVLAPVAAMSMAPTVDPQAIICSKQTANDDGHSQPAGPLHHHDHQHCSLCQAAVGAPPLAERPAFTTLDFPCASRLRWQRADAQVAFSTSLRPFQPRGPPHLI